MDTVEEIKKTALITGATSGIGAAIAIKLASEGFNLALNCHSEKSKTEGGFEVMAQCKKFGVDVKLYVADVSKFDQCEAMINQIKLDFKQIDCLVNNAATTKDGLLIRMSEADFDLVTQVNYKSVFNLTKLVGAMMIKRRSGRIVNVASVVGLCGNVGQFNYAATKAAIVGMTKTAAKEFGRRGILVNAVAPGFVETKMTNSLADSFKEEVAKKIVLGRFAKPEEIAGVVSFLCGPCSSYITGQVLVVDGMLSI